VLIALLLKKLIRGACLIEKNHIFISYLSKYILFLFLCKTELFMKSLFYAIIILGVLSCMNSSSPPSITVQSLNDSEAPAVKHYKGPLEGGFKGDSISFDVSADGKKLYNLTFKGYWRCGGKMERLIAAGPEGSFDIINNTVKDHISEPPNGGSTAWRFDINTTIDNKIAKGTFRMNINNLGCDSYLLKFTAVAK
jgi:hypothetical protein